MTILRKIYTKDKKSAATDIYISYKKKGSLIVSFLYFANAMHQRIREKKNKKQQEYNTALMNADYVFPDGIALQLFHKFHTKKTNYNLNGTDFIPYFIDFIINKSKSKKKKENIHIALRSLYDPTINKGPERIDIAQEEFKKKHKISIHHIQQNIYQQKEHGRDRSLYKESHKKSTKEKENKENKENKDKKEKNKDQINILINCSGSPFQEKRSEKNKQYIQENNILVFNAGGYVDFLSGFETRAPLRVRKVRIGETFRRIASNPKKNAKKLRWMFGICRLLNVKKTTMRILRKSRKEK